ncbi:MAG: SulP family inorganic anion transporter [Syntrophobacteraceae bacterium]
MSPSARFKLTFSNPAHLLPFLEWWPKVDKNTLRADLLAGVTGAVIVLPQAVAFATIAGLPPEYGLYSAIVPVIVAALFGSSHHLISGPTTAISLVIFTKISMLAAPFTDGYIQMVLSLTLLAGLLQLALGIARLGAVVNFVSHSVVVGFTTGAAVLIATSQLGSFLGVSIPRGMKFLNTWPEMIRLLPHVNLTSAAVAAATLVSALAFKRLKPRWPGLLFAMLVGGVLAAVLDGKAHGLAYVGALPGRLPPLSLPDLSPDTLRELIPGATAVAMLGLAEAVSIARSTAIASHQRIDNNREFIGQGLSNILGSFFSSYASSGSFTRSGVNFTAGARTPLAAVFSAVAVALILVLVAPLTAFLPVAVMAGVLMFIAIGLVDLHRIRSIFITSKPEGTVTIVTFFSTLFVELEFAIFSGVLLALLLYLNRTSHPHFISIAPDPVYTRNCFVDIRDEPVAECSQIKMVRLDGSIFFGAVNHISEELHQIAAQNPDRKHIVIVGSGINFIDISGCRMLFEEGRNLHLEGKELHLCSMKEDVEETLALGSCTLNIGRIFSSKTEAIERLLPLLDPDRCKACQTRVFRQCRELPKEPAPADSRTAASYLTGDSSRSAANSEKARCRPPAGRGS